MSPAGNGARPTQVRGQENGGAPRSYYGQPVIKEPIWTWEIPIYFFTGGLGGASAGLAYLSELRGNKKLARRAWFIALGAVSASPTLLISDLGKPSRFFNMLRMFKPTSPMSVGSWILSISGLTTAIATANATVKLFPRSARWAKPLAAAAGLPLSTYTSALIANTSVPVWHEARGDLSLVFASGAALSAGAAAVAGTPVDDAAPARRLALAGAAAELASVRYMEHSLGELISEPYHQGTPARFTKLAKGLIVGGAAAVGARGSSSRGFAVAGGLALAAGALAERWAVYKAGFASAADPKYTVAPQRERIERGDSRGASRTRAKEAATDLDRATPATSDERR